MYDVKNIFKQGGGVGGGGSGSSSTFKEKSRINVLDLYPPGLFTG